MNKPIPDRAWKLLERPGAWTQDAHARNESGRLVFPRAKDAVRWSAVGAILAVYSDRKWEVLRELTGLFQNGLGIWNNDPERTQEEVVQRLKELDI